MAQHFGSLVFTPVVKALQEKYGSRRQYARMEGAVLRWTVSALMKLRSLANVTAFTWQP